ncbi:MAG: hypothetical protein ACSLFI_08110 [Solirubrobacterales bacterium]
MVLAPVLATLAFSAAPASAADNWSGTWNTKHKFGSPKLRIDLIEKRGDDTIKGKYYDNGELIGNIRGVRDKDGPTETWRGTFKDIDSRNSTGKFSVELQSDLVSFVGWFKTCGRIFCSERYRWRGEHA